MKLKAGQINIPADDPFKEDALGRRESVVALTQLVSTIEEPFVLAVDSPWGTGKTAFIGMWKQYLINEGYPCLYFNAWENDFSDDPLVALIGEIKTGLEEIELDGKQKTEARKSFKEVKRTAANLIKKSIPLAVKLATAGIVDSKEIAKLAGDIASESIKKYENDKSTIQKFKEQLRDFVGKVRQKNKKGEEENEKPLVFFIDELDRCRPNFAIELLEKAKHFFDVTGIVFVLAIDKVQLGHSIKSIYGTGMDTDGYLRRFIDLDFRLPEPEKGVFSNALFKKFGLYKLLEDRREKVQGFAHEKGDFDWVLPRLFKMFGFSLRVQEHCVSRLNIILRTTPLDNYLHPLFLGTLISLKEANHNLYGDFLRYKANYEPVLSYLKKCPGSEELFKDNYGTAIEAYFVGACGDEKVRLRGRKAYKDIEDNESLSTNERQRAHDVIEFIQMNYRDGVRNALDYLSKKIELSEHFVGE